MIIESVNLAERLFVLYILMQLYCRSVYKVFFASRYY